MVVWYKHDIPAWMDGTSGLSDAAYRAFHIICQMIYLGEGPIALNERYLSGACNQSIRGFRSALAELVEAGKISVADGKIANSRAAFELLSVKNNRENARKGGEKSGEVRKSPENPKENNADGEATLQNNRSLREKKRLDERRREKKERIPPSAANSDAQSDQLFPPNPPTDEKQYFDRCKQILGKNGGSLGAKLLRSKKTIAMARAAIETASTKSDPAQYVGAMIRNTGEGQRPGYGEEWW